MKAIIPCEKNVKLRKMIKEYAETLKTEAHKLGTHGLDEKDFYYSGLFRGAIESVRGEFVGTTKPKREFVQHVLNHMMDHGFIKNWESAGDANRYDYIVTMNTGRITAIELKGALDGNNTNIYERPPQAEEFIIWSISTNAGGDPRHNAWSGIHTRLSADIISRKQQIDGVIIWDWVCGTSGRPCPKLSKDEERKTEAGPFVLPPPCIYVLPATVPSPRNNPHPVAQRIDDVQLLKAFNECFLGRDEDINYVDIEVSNKGTEIVRKTRIVRNGETQQESKATPIRRS